MLDGILEVGQKVLADGMDPTRESRCRDDSECLATRPKVTINWKHLCGAWFVED